MDVGDLGVVKCPEAGTTARTRWKKCWVAFFSCLCWLDSGRMPGVPAAPPGRSWVLFQSPRGLWRAREQSERGRKVQGCSVPWKVGRAIWGLASRKENPFPDWPGSEFGLNCPYSMDQKTKAGKRGQVHTVRQRQSQGWRPSFQALPEARLR